MSAPENQFINDDSHWHAGPAIIAVRAIGKGPATAKTSLYQPAIYVCVNQVAGRRHLRPRQLFRQVAARVRCGRVKL